jgi:hypothetical protein
MKNELTIRHALTERRPDGEHIEWKWHENALIREADLPLLEEPLFLPLIYVDGVIQEVFMIPRSPSKRVMRIPLKG